MTCGIYKITCKANHKVYIGQSKNIVARWYAHKYLLSHNRHGNKHLQRAWNKYKEKSFKFEILQTCNESERGELEKYWIAIYDSTDPEKGYNSEWGGLENIEVSEQTRLKQSLAKIGCKQSAETCAKKHLSMLGKNAGKKMSLEQRNHLSKVKSSPFTNDAIAFYEEGNSMMETCKKFHVCFERLRDLLRQKGTYREYARNPSNAVKEYLNGKSLCKSALDNHLDWKTLRKILTTNLVLDFNRRSKSVIEKPIDIYIDGDKLNKIILPVIHGNDLLHFEVGTNVKNGKRFTILKSLDSTSKLKFDVETDSADDFMSLLTILKYSHIWLTKFASESVKP